MYAKRKHYVSVGAESMWTKYKPHHCEKWIKAKGAWVIRSICAAGD